MDKRLLKFIMYSIISLLILIIVFPMFFSNISNDFSYIGTKIIMMFKNINEDNVSIYKEKANVIFMFDDGWKSQYTIAYKYMNDKNMRGSIGIIPSLIGEPEYMSTSDLYNLYNDNWDLLNHTYNHMALSREDLKKQIKEISKAEQWLNNRGFTSSRKVLIYPEGKYNFDTLKAIVELNYNSGRTIADGFNSLNKDNIYEVKVKNVIPVITLDDIKFWVEHAIENKLTLILLFHKIDNELDDTNMKYKIDDFYKIVDYIDSKRNELNIITYLEWLELVENE